MTAPGARRSIITVPRASRRFPPSHPGGATVLALCADALRRRALVERAATPARFRRRHRRARLRAPGRRWHPGRRRQGDRRPGSGVVLADWAALERNPAMASRFDHVVIVDPAPFRRLESRCIRRPGFSAPRLGRG